MNDPAAVTLSWSHDYWQALVNPVYTTTVFCLALASVTLFVQTKEGILEMVTCLGLFLIDIFSWLSEASMRKKSRQNRSRNFVGMVKYRNSPTGSWKEKSGIDLSAGDTIKLSVGSVVPADVKWMKGSSFLCETTFALNGDHRIGGGVGGDSGEDLSGIVCFGPPSKEMKQKPDIKARDNLRRRKQEKTKQIVSGVVIEDVSSSDSDAELSSSSKAYDLNRSTSDQAEGFPIEQELNAGGMIIAGLDDGDNFSSSFVECQVLRVGADSLGWKAAAKSNEKVIKLRERKRSPALPTSLPYAVLLLVSIAIAFAVPYFLSLRSDRHAVMPTWYDLANTFFNTVSEQLKGLVGLGGDATTETESKATPSTEQAMANSVARLASLASLVAIDQCKCLLHLGMTMLCYTCVGTRLIFQSCESTAQQLLAQRGALLKPKYSGCNVQRIAEVDTILFTHCSPRGISKEDAAAIHRLKLVGLDIKVLSPTIQDMGKKLNKASTLTGLSESDFLAASTSAGKSLSEVLQLVGLPSQVAMAGEDAQSDRVEKAGGILVALEGSEAQDYKNELVEGARKVAVWEAAMEERRKVGPMKAAPVKRPSVAPLPKSGVAAATQLVEDWHLNSSRCVLVTADDSEDGRTLPLLFSAHVGVVCGNTHLTKAKKKATGKESSDSKSPSVMAAASGLSKKEVKKEMKMNVKEAKKKEISLFGDVGDVAMMSGMPLGLSPIADMITVSIFTARLQHVVQMCRAASMLAAAAFLFSQVWRASVQTSATSSLTGVEAGAVWEESVMRRGVVFGGALRVPLALLIADVFAMFVLTPPTPKNRGSTDQILSASLSCSSSTIGASRRLSRSKQLFSLFFLAVYMLGGMLVFHSHVLPYQVPKMLPSIREYLEGTDLIFGPSVASEQLNNSSSSPREMNEIDRDMCSFLFLIYSITLSTAGCLSMSKALWRTRLSNPYLVLGMPFCLVTLLAVATNGMLGGVHEGGDPASGVATLLFAFAYFYTGCATIFFFIPPFF